MSGLLTLPANSAYTLINTSHRPMPGFDVSFAITLLKPILFCTLRSTSLLPPFYFFLPLIPAAGPDLSFFGVAFTALRLPPTFNASLLETSRSEVRCFADCCTTIVSVSSWWSVSASSSLPSLSLALDAVARVLRNVPGTGLFLFFSFLGRSSCRFSSFC